MPGAGGTQPPDGQFFGDITFADLPGRWAPCQRQPADDSEQVQPTVLQRRRAGLLVLGSVAEAGDVGCWEPVDHPGADVELVAVEAIVEQSGDGRAHASQDVNEQVRSGPARYPVKINSLGINEK